MAFTAKLHQDGGSATIRLSGDLDSTSAPELNELVTRAAEGELDRLVLIMSDLTYMSSAGLRCLLFAHQKMSQEAEIVLVGTQPEVAEMIRLTGFDRSVVMQGPADT